MRLTFFVVAGLFLLPNAILGGDKAPNQFREGGGPPTVVRSGDRLTVLFLWDRSLSIPQDWYFSAQQFINAAVEHAGKGHRHDNVGLLMFGRGPCLELQSDPSLTDIAAALKLALASFPEGARKRVILLSDGNENLGTAEEQARMARQNGIQIDVVPLSDIPANKRKQENLKDPSIQELIQEIRTLRGQLERLERLLVEHEKKNRK